MPYRKKLIEVALPLEAINEASDREKSIRHGHPSSLHPMLEIVGFYTGDCRLTSIW